MITRTMMHMINTITDISISRFNIYYIIMTSNTSMRIRGTYTIKIRLYLQDIPQDSLW